jgi:2-iminobutanoate/2-iminopropanoate deaminase
MMQKRLVLVVATVVWPFAIARTDPPALNAAEARSVLEGAADESVPAAGGGAFAGIPAFAPVSTHGGLIYVSGILPSEPVPADFTTQATRVLDELKARLGQAGATMDRVASTSVYLASAEDFPALNAVWVKYWPTAPPARTTVVAQLPVVGARIQVSAIAAAPGVNRAALLPEGWAAPAGPFSYAIRAGDTLFLSGLVPRRGSDNAMVKGDIETQTHVIFENAKAILAAAGLTYADVVSARVFLTTAGVFDRMNGIYRTYFQSEPPARATVMTPLASPDFLIEITMTAVKGPSRVAVVAPNADGTPGRPNPNLSSAIGAGSRLFLSGMLGVLPGNASDAASQTAETLSRLERTLAAGGCGWPHVTDSVVYVTDMPTAAAIVETFRTRAGGRLPVGTLVGTGLMSPDGRVEIMLTAGK